MPEGPEIKYMSEICKKYIKGCELVDIISNSKTVIKVPKKSKVIDVVTKGKLMVLVCEDYYFHIHFGLTGWLVFENPEFPRYELEFKKGNEKFKAYIDDSRRFSKLKIVNKTQHDKAFAKLGVDILTPEFTLLFFLETIKKTKKKIVAFLLEQNKFCGVGNYIKNESLYIAKIDPYRNCDDLDDDEIEKLYNAILFCTYSNTLEFLKENKKDVKPDKKFMKMLNSIDTEVPYEYKVYQQDKDPKGHKVIHTDIGGRKTYYVKEVQK